MVYYLLFFVTKYLIYMALSFSFCTLIKRYERKISREVGGGRTSQIQNLYRKGEGSALLTRALENFVAKLLRGGSIGLNLWGLPTYIPAVLKDFTKGGLLTSD